MNGQDLINETNARLAGYQNGVDPEALLSYLNEGKDEVWALLKELNEEYFVTSSQGTDATAVNYFPTMSTTSRQYTLPCDLREMKFIEVATAGFTEVIFEYRDITDEDFRNARRDATTLNQLLVGPCTVYYTIVGKDQMLLAQYLPAALDITLWYVRSLPDFEADQDVDDVLLPYVKKVANYAAKKAMISLQDPGQWSMWVAEWKQDCITLQSGAAERNASDPTFASDFCG